MGRQPGAGRADLGTAGGSGDAVTLARRERKKERKNTMKYNYKDAPGKEKGFLGEGKPKAARIYHLLTVGPRPGQALVESADAWGRVTTEIVCLADIVPYNG